jgi:Ca2+-transporting ATPase
MAFATLAAFQWFKAFSARSTRQSLLSIGPFSNRWLNVGVAAAIVLQLLAFYTPVGRAVFDLVHLAPLDWAIVGGVSVSVLLADEVVKLARRLFANDGR